jgi:large subunit ribosomal protein L10
MSFTQSLVRSYAPRIFYFRRVFSDNTNRNVMKGSHMARPDKAAAVAELTEDFKSSTATLLTEYRGLTVTSMKELRRSLGSTTKYSVVKNTLTKIAAKNAGVDISDDLLVGPSALAFVKGDPIDAAKAMKNFQKENPLLIIKGGIFEGKAVTTAEIMKLADLESREVLLSKLAGAMKGTMAKAARTFDALRIKMEAGAPAATPVVEVSTPSTDSAEAEVPAVAATEATESVETQAEVVAETTEAPAAEATETPAE